MLCFQLFIFSFVVICFFCFFPLNLFYSEFSQLTFQSIFCLFSVLILCSVCKLAFGLCPLSQQIFVHGLFCSHLTADHQRQCLWCTALGFFACSNGSAHWDFTFTWFWDPLVITLLEGKDSPIFFSLLIFHNLWMWWLFLNYVEAKESNTIAVFPSLLWLFSVLSRISCSFIV